jgi:hypothetical protein
METVSTYETQVSFYYTVQRPKRLTVSTETVSLYIFKKYCHTFKYTGLFLKGAPVLRVKKGLLHLNSVFSRSLLLHDIGTRAITIFWHYWTQRHQIEWRLLCSYVIICNWNWDAFLEWPCIIYDAILNSRINEPFIFLVVETFDTVRWLIATVAPANNEYLVIDDCSGHGTSFRTHVWDWRPYIRFRVVLLATA